MRRIALEKAACHDPQSTRVRPHDSINDGRYAMAAATIKSNQLQALPQIAQSADGDQ